MNQCIRTGIASAPWPRRKIQIGQIGRRKRAERLIPGRIISAPSAGQQFNNKSTVSCSDSAPPTTPPPSLPPTRHIFRSIEDAVGEIIHLNHFNNRFSFVCFVFFFSKLGWQRWQHRRPLPKIHQCRLLKAQATLSMNSFIDPWRQDSMGSVALASLLHLRNRTSTAEFTSK